MLTLKELDMLELCLILPGMKELYDSAEVNGELPFTGAGELNEEWTHFALWLTGSAFSAAWTKAR